MSGLSQYLFEKYNCCVLIPTYNNEGTLATLIESVLHHTNRIIVVNDGATDNTKSILEKFPQLHVVTFSSNKGKGMALRAGFKAAVAKGYDRAITLDSDGQHFADDIPHFFEKLDEQPDALIVGARNMSGEGIPGRSSFGHKISNFWFHFETGINLPDTQSGFRLYPVRELSKLNFFTTKFEFEIEVLVRASWIGIPVVSVPIKVFYAQGKERVTHFRPFTDFTRVGLLHTGLVILTFLWFFPQRFFNRIKKKNFKRIFRESFTNPTESASVKSASVGFGLFMGIFPVWGYQMIIAFALAHIFRLNKAIVIIASNISIPPMIPFILFGSMKTGSLLLGEPLALTFHDITLDAVKKMLVQYIPGSIVFALLVGFLGWLITFAILRFSRKNA